MLYLLTININSANFVIFLKQKCFLSFAGFNAKHVCAINNTKEVQRRNTGGTKKLFLLTLSVGLKVRFILIYIEDCASVAKYLVCGCCCRCFIYIFFVSVNLADSQATQNLNTVAKRFIYTYMHIYKQF